MCMASCLLNIERQILKLSGNVFVYANPCIVKFIVIHSRLPALTLNLNKIRCDPLYVPWWPRPLSLIFIMHITIWDHRCVLHKSTIHTNKNLMSMVIIQNICVSFCLFWRTEIKLPFQNIDEYSFRISQTLVHMLHL